MLLLAIGTRADDTIITVRLCKKAIYNGQLADYISSTLYSPGQPLETLMDYESPKPCGLSKDAIWQVAERFAETVNYAPAADLEKVLAGLKGKLEYQDFWKLDDGDSGAITIESDKSFTIFVANHTSIARDRFTIAHELGHLVLHYLLPRSSGQYEAIGMKAARSGNGLTEIEANQFAGAFLMPANLFMKKFETAKRDIVETADYFGVSVAAASARADALGI
jgi:predicted transcriptional regulator